MFDLDISITSLHRLLARQKNNAAGTLGIAFKHFRRPDRPIIPFVNSSARESSTQRPGRHGLWLAEDKEPELHAISACRKLGYFYSTMHHNKQLLEEAKKLGVHGYVAKTQASEVLLKAVDTLFRKQTFYPRARLFRYRYGVAQIMELHRTAIADV